MGKLKSPISCLAMLLLQARIIILEGRVRFLEGAVEEHADKINHKCQDCGRVEVPASKLLIPKPSGYDDEVHLVVPRKYSSGNAAGERPPAIACTGS